MINIFQPSLGEEVIMPTCSFVGAANAVIDREASVVFCDVDNRSLNVTAKNVEEKFSPKTKTVCILHFGGVPCEMDEIVERCAVTVCGDSDMIYVKDKYRAARFGHRKKLYLPDIRG